MIKLFWLREYPQTDREARLSPAPSGSTRPTPTPKARSPASTSNTTSTTGCSSTITTCAATTSAASRPRPPWNGWASPKRAGRRRSSASSHEDHRQADRTVRPALRFQRERARGRGRHDRRRPDRPGQHRQVTTQDRHPQRPGRRAGRGAGRRRPHRHLADLLGRMRTSRILVAGGWREACEPAGVFSAVDPATGDGIPGEYPVSSWSDLEDALAAGAEAASLLAQAGPDRIAAFLDGMAEGLERRADELVEAAHRETGLPAEPRLRSVELPRTTAQLRQAAAACRDRSWCRATIDTKLDIRSRLAPLGGPVAVFGPNNFPFAFNAVGGGDFAAALAAGNPVIAKANPGSPGTTRIMAEAAVEALCRIGLPSTSVQMLYHFSAEDGRRLVSHPLVGATGFTGSRTAGLGLKEAADRAGKPIYLEMSSVNPVFVLPGALRERGAEVAAELFASCAAGAGQFCTKPGLLVYAEGPESAGFRNGLAAAFDGAPAGVLLGQGVLKGLEAGYHG
ncbi:MAG: aldehyde dehydrogenase family protein [Desulfobacterales bacterium]|nr:aldehyde dehydrogenase family protein [Desulfobacterales bacterium]